MPKPRRKSSQARKTAAQNIAKVATHSGQKGSQGVKLLQPTKETLGMRSASGQLTSICDSETAKIIICRIIVFFVEIRLYK